MPHLLFFLISYITEGQTVPNLVEGNLLLGIFNSGFVFAVLAVAAVRRRIRARTANH